MNDWFYIFNSSIISAALVLSVMGLLFAVAMPELDRWSKRFFQCYFIVFILCCLTAFAELLLCTYLGKIDGYNGEKVAFVRERANQAGDRVEQQTLLTMKDGKKIPVDYRMLPKNGGWCVYDVVVEGVSLVKNYRTQFQDILQTSSPDELTARVKTKALEARNAGNAK